MANPFANWTPQMVQEFNAKNAPFRSIQVLPPDAFSDPDTKAASITNQKKKKPLLNRLETAWKFELERRGHKNIVAQGITLRLGEDCRYTPDFFTFEEFDLNFRITAWECKGPHAWDDSIVKLKTAAHQYPFICFVLVKRDKKTKAWVEKMIGQ